MKIITSLIISIAISSGLFSQTLVPKDDGSKVKFIIKNFGIGTGGSFMGLKGVIKYDPKNPVSSSFEVSVDAVTIDTDMPSRDNHLKKEEYLDVNRYPQITIKSTRITKTNTAEFLYFFGHIIIKGVTKEIKFPFSVVAKDGGYLFEGNFSINRRDFNVGGRSLSLSDDLDVELSVFAK